MINSLQEARATELALVQTLQAHIAMTPRGSYRSLLERHLRETRDHASRVDRRLRELGERRSPARVIVGLGRSAVGQFVSVGKLPVDLIRGGATGEEKVLKNAKDECASEALEIATYRAIEAAALQLGDKSTAALAASIGEDEQAMLDALLEALPGLATAALEGGSYDVTRTGAAEAAQKVAKQAATSARDAARRVPGEARVEGTIQGAVASAGDLPIRDYDDLSAEEINKRLAQLGQRELALVDFYERRHQRRSTVLDRIAELRGDQPWAGYDDANVDDVKAKLSDADADTIRTVLEYERRHKNRSTVIDAAQRRRELVTG